jgi:hypothetical protein
VLDWWSSLPWLRPALDLLRLALFATFVALGVAAMRARARPRVDRLLAFVLGLSLAVGLTQVEAWPFTNWALVHSLAPTTVTSWELEATDASGRVWPVDARVLQPLAPEEFGAWMMARVPSAPEDARARLGEFLLERAEAGRRDLRAGRVVGRNERLLGPLAAPFHFQQKRVWHSAADVPAAPFVSVRMNLLTWVVEERATDESRVARRPLLQYVRP